MVYSIHTHIYTGADTGIFQGGGLTFNYKCILKMRLIYYDNIQLKNM